MLWLACRWWVLWSGTQIVYITRQHLLKQDKLSSKKSGPSHEFLSSWLLNHCIPFEEGPAARTFPLNKSICWESLRQWAKNCPAPGLMGNVTFCDHDSPHYWAGTGLLGWVWRAGTRKCLGWVWSSLPHRAFGEAGEADDPGIFFRLENSRVSETLNS